MKRLIVAVATLLLTALLPQLALSGPAGAAPGQAPVAHHDRVTVQAGAPVTIRVMSNDQVFRKRWARVRLMGSAGHRTEAPLARVRRNHTVRFTTPATMAPGRYRMRYRVTDVRGRAATARIVLRVTGPEQPDTEQPDTEQPGTTDPGEVDRMAYGISGYEGRFGDTYPRLVNDLPADAAYYYGQHVVRWDEVAMVPDDQPVWIQTLSGDPAEYARMLASFPATRRAPVYVFHQNEPDKPGKVDIGTWQANTDALVDAIDASGRDYVVPSISIMYYTLQQTLRGTTDPVRQMSTWVRPGIEHVVFSAYADKRVVDGHEVATISPTKMPQTIAAWHDESELSWSTVTGWGIGNDYRDDPVTVQNRVDWLSTAAPNLDSAGSAALLWFNRDWQRGDRPGDHRIEQDPDLLAAWRGLAG